MRKTCEKPHVCTGYFVFFMLLHETDFSCLAVEAVIMHKTKRFSHVIRVKIIVRDLQNVCSKFSHYFVCTVFSSKFLVSRMFFSSRGCLAGEHTDGIVFPLVKQSNNFLIIIINCFRREKWTCLKS